MINTVQSQSNKVTEAALIAHGFWDIPRINWCYRDTTIMTNIMYALRKNKDYVESYWSANGSLRQVGLSDQAGLIVNTYRTNVRGVEKEIQAIYDYKRARSSADAKIDWNDMLICINIMDGAVEVAAPTEEESPLPLVDQLALV